MPNSVDFYERTSLHIISTRIIVPYNYLQSLVTKVTKGVWSSTHNQSSKIAIPSCKKGKLRKTEWLDEKELCQFIWK